MSPATGLQPSLARSMPAPTGAFLLAFCLLCSCGDTSPIGPCQSDADCPASMVCDLLAHSCAPRAPVDQSAATDALPDAAPPDADATVLPDFTVVLACRKDADCAAPTPRCEPLTGTCVACLPTADNCPLGQHCVHSGPRYLCADSCQAEPDCQSDGGPRRSCCTGACFDTASDADNCGACGRACPQPPHSTFVCAGGLCRIGACDPGWGACSGNVADGCSTNTDIDLRHCGGCGKACGGPNVQHAKATCAKGVCTLACDAGFADCNGDTADGCEANLMTDDANCGGCKQPCALVNHQFGTCKMGACLPGACEHDWTDCTGDPKMPCNTFLGDPAHCGACKNACAPMLNAQPGCAFLNGMYRCAPGMCLPGWGDCDKNPANGCEKSLLADLKNCGACGNACIQNGDVPACLNGKCGYTMCLPGNVDCNKDPVDGCEANFMLSNDNCGACGVVCPAGPHAVGLCQGGQCTLGCDINYHDCDKNPNNGCEVRNDVNNCGSCFNSCGAGPHITIGCPFGLCEYLCDPGWDACDGAPFQGCNTDIANDPLNCGKCRTVCSLPNAQPGCAKGACTVKACNAGFADCDGNPANGCEINTNTDAKNCGKCANVCPMNAATCLAGVCSGLPRVLVLWSSGFAGAEVAVQTGLMATGAFSLVDTFNVVKGTPTLMQLQAYDAVLVWSNLGWINPVAAGDRLADYWDGGGRVVLTVDLQPPDSLAGRFGTAANGYRLLTPQGTFSNSGDSIGARLEPMSPLLAGVVAFDAMSAYRMTGNIITNGGIVVADWLLSHDPLIIRGVVKGRGRVDVNLHPVPAPTANGSWKGDGFVILKNALLYK